MLIQHMRDGSEGVLAKVIIGLIIIVFALFGFGSITTFLAPTPKVATVDGEDISQQEMEVAVERNRRMLMARDIPAEEIDEDKLREDVLDSLVTRTVLAQTAGNLDLHYSDAALDQEIIASEVFMLDGIFSSEQFKRVIGSAGYTPLSYRAEMRTDKLFDQMITGIRQSAFITPDEAKRYSGLLSQRRDIAYIQIAVPDLIDEVTVTDDEIEEYFNANSSDFVTDETVNLQYIELKREDLAAAYELDEDELRDYFEENKGVYSTDESRRVAHILIEIDDDTGAEEAEALAIEVHGRIVDGGDFTALAKEYSDDLGSQDSGGDLGFNNQGTFFPEFEAVAYDLSLNQVSGPVQTEIGFHIIKVLGIEEANLPGLDEVRAEVEQIYRHTATEDDFVSKSSRMAELLFENFSELESTASAIELDVKITGDLKRDANHELMSVSRVVAAAFSPDVLVDGNNSDLIEVSEDHHIGLRVLEHKPSSIRALSEVTEDVRYILQREKAAELAQTRAKEIVAAIDSGSLAQFVADEYSLEWQVALKATRFDQEVDPFILGEAFKLLRPVENKESLGVATLLNGDSVVLRVSSVVNRPAGEIEESELAGVQAGLARQMGLSDFQEFQQSLKQEATLERVN
ncbi:MAG: hypothetical protein HOC70_08705 [Gammaproteobacteria bacterium]|jgi:peptidyl-prolyl cis-trans isomerase D|nr:hypothetical protein [Gammaproteobacteria bacterium]MBT4493314.1 hypothetical protein [Gammaproteobacteria bacterium]